MGWRLGAAWALIGFAAQCFVSLADGDAFGEGMKQALVHYAAWGVAGLLVGTVMERMIEDAFKNLVEKHQDKPASSEAGPPGQGQPNRTTS